MPACNYTFVAVADARDTDVEVLSV